MKVGLKAKCPGCGLSTDFVSKRPGLRESLVLRVPCENCKSHLLLRVAQINRTEARVQVRGLEPSEYLKLMLIEELEHRKKEISDGTHGSDEPRSDA